MSISSTSISTSISTSTSTPTEFKDPRYQLYLNDVKENGNYKEFISTQNYKCVLQRNLILGIWTCKVTLDKNTKIKNNIKDINIDNTLNYYEKENNLIIYFDCGHIYDFIPADLKVTFNLFVIPSDKVYRDYNYAYNKLLELCDQIKKIEDKI